MSISGCLCACMYNAFPVFFLGSMLHQYMALSVSFVSFACRKKLVCPFVGLHCGCIPPPLKICVSICWVTLWVRPPPCENVCVRSFGYIVGASHPCVSFQWKTIFVVSLHAAYSALRHFFLLELPKIST